MKSSFVAILFFLFFVPSSFATPEYAEQTGYDCERCHIDSMGGKLTAAGEQFRNDLKAKGLYRPLQPFQKAVRLVIGYLHLLTAIAWFGTILYVHILLKPAYAARGLPKGELILGWLSIGLMAITGTLLTLARIPSFHLFYTTRFGMLLGIKIILFIIMASSAAVVTFVIGPRMKKRIKLPAARNGEHFSSAELSYFDGKEGRPAYFAYQGKVYDVSSSRLWREGSHMKKHGAGSDLTNLLKTAPHGDEKILTMPVVGSLITGETKGKPPRHEKVFYGMAYMNLVFVFVITFIVALWRWT